MLLSSPVTATETSAQTPRSGRTRLAAVLAACAASWLATDVAVVPLAAVPQTARATAPGGLEILEVRPNFFLIAGAGGSIAVQVGEDGAVVVDAGSVASAAAVVEAIKSLTPKPIRYVIDTGPDADHVGGNEVLSKAGEADIRSGRRESNGSRHPGGRRRAAAHVLDIRIDACVSGRRLADRDLSLRAQVHVLER